MTDITCVYFLSLETANVDDFKKLVVEIVAAANHEAGTLIYEYSASQDERQFHIVERYRSEAILPHVELTFAPFAERFLELAKIEHLYVYGVVPQDIRDKLDVFSPVYMSPVAGFSKLFAVA
jgi:quinol monooxygenase YgiN